MILCRHPNLVSTRKWLLVKHSLVANSQTRTYLIIVTEGNNKKDGNDTFEACYPFSALGTLSTNVDEPKLNFSGSKFGKIITIR